MYSKININGKKEEESLYTYLFQKGGAQKKTPASIKETADTLDQFVYKIITECWEDFIKQKKNITRTDVSILMPFIDTQIACAVVNKLDQRESGTYDTGNKLTIKKLTDMLKSDFPNEEEIDTDIKYFICNEVLLLNSLLSRPSKESGNPKTINITPLTIDDFIFVKKAKPHTFVQPDFGKTPTPAKLKLSPHDINNVPESAQLFPLMVGLMPYEPFRVELELPRICNFPPFVVELSTAPELYTQAHSHDAITPIPGTELIDCFARGLLNMNVHLSAVYQSKLNTLVGNYIEKLANSTYGESYTSMIIQLDLLNIYDSRYIYRAVSGIIENTVTRRHMLKPYSTHLFTKNDMNEHPHALISYQKYQIWKMLFTFHCKVNKCFNKQELNYMTLCVIHTLGNGHVINFGYYKKKFFIADIQNDRFISDNNLNNIVTLILDIYGNIDNMELLTRIPRTKTFAEKNIAAAQEKQILVLIRAMVKPGSLRKKVINYLNDVVIKLYVTPDTTVSELKILVSNHPHILNLKAVLIAGSGAYADDDKIKNMKEYKAFIKKHSRYITLYAGIIKEPDTPPITVIPDIQVEDDSGLKGRSK